MIEGQAALPDWEITLDDNELVFFEWLGMSPKERFGYPLGKREEVVAKLEEALEALKG